MRRGRWAVPLTVAALLLASCSGDDGTDVQVSSNATEPAPADVEVLSDADEVVHTAPLAGYVVAIDPSHNGGQFEDEDAVAHLIEPDGLPRPCNTLGAVTADGVTESSIVWTLAQDVAAKLETLGARVELTRQDDDGVGPCVDERGEFAGEVGADLLLSLHADAGPPDGSGFSVVHPLPLRSRADADTIDEAARLAVDVRDSLVVAGLRPSDYLGTDGIHPRDDLGTVNVATVPAVSVELGNLHHDGDAALLTSRPDQERIAGALAAATSRHLTAARSD